MSIEVACHHRLGSGIYCETPTNCDKCGWNYAVESSRKARIRGKANKAPKGKYLIGRGSFENVKRVL